MAMQRTKSQFARVMALDRLIRDGKFPNCLTFAADYEVSQKTVQRDVDFLRDQCDAPIGYDRNRKGFFYTDPSYLLPSVSMSEGELLAVLLAARTMEQYRGTPVAGQLGKVFAKLAEMLPDKVSVGPEMLHARFTFRGPPAKPVDAAVWAAVVRGLMDQRSLAIRYRPFGVEKADAGKESRVNPYHVANLQGEWYLFGAHAGHDDVRQFSMARIEKAALTRDAFTMPADFDATKMLGGTFGRYASGETRTVRLLFAKDVAGWVTEREWHPQQVVRRRRGGSVELTFPAKGLFEVQRWVLSWGRGVSVLGPTELKKAVSDEIRAMAARQTEDERPFLTGLRSRENP
jgi:proteasome accessory factor B